MFCGDRLCKEHAPAVRVDVVVLDDALCEELLRVGPARARALAEFVNKEQVDAVLERAQVLSPS
jgi:hypothetical protein